MELEVIIKSTVMAIFGFVAIFGVLVWRNPKQGAQIILFLLPTYLIKIRIWVPVPTNVLELLIIMFVLVALLRIFLGKDELSAIPKDIKYPLMLIVGGALISAIYGVVLVGENPEITRGIFGALKGFILIPIAFAIVVSFLKSLRRETKNILKSYVFSAVFVAGFSVLQAEEIAGFLTYDGRLSGFYLSPNHLAMYILPAIFLIIWNLKFRINRENVERSALFLILFSALLWTQSIGAIIGFFAGIFLLFILRRWPKSAKSIFLYSALFILIVSILIPIIGSAFASTAWETGWRSPVASRLMIWRVSGEILQEHGLLGIGPGAFQHHYLALQDKFPQYLEWAVPMPHSLWLALWLQTGILGLTGFVWLVWGALRRIPKDGYAIAASVVLVAILVHGFVDTPFFKNDLAIVFLFIVLASQVPRIHGQR